MPIKTTLPRVEPLVPTLRPAPFDDPEWLFQPKLDGFRALVYLTHQTCRMYSKRGNQFSRFEDLRQRICTELPRCEAILDGEVVALDDAGRVNFLLLMRGQGHLAYAPFDLLWLNGKDLRELPLAQRLARLERLVPVTTATLLRVLSFAEQGCALFEAACGLDLEGIVAKRRSDPYGPRTTWFKIKHRAYGQAEGRGFERRHTNA